MKVLLHSLVVLSVSLLNLTSSLAMGRKQAQTVAFIEAESTVPQEQLDLLRDDFKWLGSFKPETPTSEFQSVLEVSSASPEVLTTWLDQRVNYLLSEDFQLNFKNIQPTFFTGFKYPGSPLPDIELPEQRERLEGLKRAIENSPSENPSVAEKEEAEPQEKRGTVVMTNVGTAVYLIGKMVNFPLKLRVRGLGWVRATSPRVGAIQVGEGLFKKDMIGADVSYNSPAMRAMRMSTFFHEARHSDGNGKSMGFTHALCPEGHNLQNLNGCERNLNGAYTVGALISEHIVKVCVDCSEKEREIIRAIALDARNRIIPAKDGSPASEWDATSESYFVPRVKKEKQPKKATKPAHAGSTR